MHSWIDVNVATGWQRTWIALLEKGLPFTYKEVSLRNPSTGLWFPLQEKPKWFTALNPLGKVRLLFFHALHSAKVIPFVGT